MIMKKNFHSFNDFVKLAKSLQGFGLLGLLRINIKGLSYRPINFNIDEFGF